VSGAAETQKNKYNSNWSLVRETKNRGEQQEEKLQSKLRENRERKGVLRVKRFRTPAKGEREKLCKLEQVKKGGGVLGRKRKGRAKLETGRIFRT